jgi:excisionase family DNA binding protein
VPARKPKPKTRPDRPVLSVHEVADFLGISRSLAYDAINSGEIPSIRVGTRKLVPRAALDALLASPLADRAS